MDFQTLNRRELQALCKLNKIPANMTNIAMVDALKSLETVEGIEEFMNPSRSETDRLSPESPERNEITSPRVPRTSCRTSTRQKTKKVESESVHATVSRATVRGVRRQLTGNVDEALNTPMVSSTRKKTLATSSIQDVASQLNDTVKKETATVQRAYSTRRSVRLTAHKSSEPDVERERNEPVKIESFSDEVNETLQENFDNSITEKSEQTGDNDKKVEEVCNEFEKLDVVVVNESDENSKIEEIVDVDTSTLESEVEKVDCCDEVDNLKVDTSTLESEEEKVDCCDEVDNINVNLEENLEQIENVDSEVMCNENGDSEEKKMVIDENIDENALSFNPSDSSMLKLESMSEMKNEVSEHNVENVELEDLKPNSEGICNEDGDSIEKQMVIDENIDKNTLSYNTENPSDPSILKNESMRSAVSVMKNEVSEYNVDCVDPNKEEVDMDFEAPVVEEQIATDGSFIKEENQISMDMNVSLGNSPISIKGMIIEDSDNKENEENVNEKEDGVDVKAKSLNETSLRQLKKQLKALTIKNNIDASCETITEMEN